MVDYRKIECPWCHNVLFTPISNVNVAEFNGLNVFYRETMCPDCMKKITIIEDITTKFAEDVVLRHDDDNDKVAPLFTELGNKYKTTLDGIRVDIDERIGKLRDEWDNPETEKVKVVLVAPDGKELKDLDELTDYIRDNYDEYDLRDWINAEFSPIEIGPYSFDASDIIEALEGSFSDIASETYECNYAADKVDNADIVAFDEYNDPDSVDIPVDGSTVDVAGMTFTFKWIKREKEDDDKI